MRIVFFSDTHRKHGILDYSLFEGADVVVFSGDMSGRGQKHEIEDFLVWYSAMPIEKKIFISGNHDFFWEKTDELDIKLFLENRGLIYLNDSEVVIDGIKFWGSPITPFFHNWAFNRLPGDDIEKHWSLIPNDVDVLITHGPPYGILDEVNNSYSSDIGCPQLMKKIEEIKPQAHCFGHIHEGYGKVIWNETTFINSSIMDEKYEPTNKPISLEIFKRN